MKNTRENAESFIKEFIKNFVNEFPDQAPHLAELLVEYANRITNGYIPNDAHSLEVFAIKDSNDSPTGKQAFIGYKLDNGNFEFTQVPYTEPK